MTEKILIPDNEIWANAGDKTKPDIDRFAVGNEQGSTAEPPEASDHNFQMNRADVNLQYILRFGGLEYSSSEIYPLNGRALKDGIIYKSLTDNNVGNTPAYGSDFWIDERDDSYPRGIAYPYHGMLADIPDGFWVYDGREFDIETNPKNAKIFPSGKLPDYTGRVPEGFISTENGDIGTTQQGKILSHAHDANFSGNNVTPSASASSTFTGTSFSLGGNGQDETQAKPSASDGNNSFNWKPSGTVNTTVTVASFTPSGNVSVNPTGSSRNTVDRVICLWIGRVG